MAEIKSNKHRKKHRKKKRKKVRVVKKKKNSSSNKKRIRRKKNSKKINLFRLSISLFLAIVLYMIVFFLFFSIGKMDGYSMLPTINDKNLVGVSRGKQIRRFDLVYLTPPNNSKEKSIRRVIGLPGDVIEFENDELIINNEGKEERYLMSKKKSIGSMILTDDFTLQEVIGKSTVPDGTCFVLGDNRKTSTDSRFYGVVPMENVIGKVSFRLTPLRMFKIF